MKNKYDYLFKAENGLIAWLKDMKDNVIEVNPLDIFKVYKPMDRGNSKLFKNILSFSLPPISTCGEYCKGCYDIRSFRHTVVRKKRYVNYSLAMHKRKELKEMIIKQILNSRNCQYIRLHVGGDFFSLDYVNMWKEIADKVQSKKPAIKFYTYTKGFFTNNLKEAGINVVRSIYPEGYNFGSVEYVKALKAQYGGVICPVTIMANEGKKVPSQYCGKNCQACMDMENVFFIKH